MASEKYQPGETAKTLARNVRQLREQNNMNIAQLSKALRDVGCNMTPTSVKRLEEEKRKVDVDDLMALSAVFSVVPYRLLLPYSDSLSIEVAEQVEATTAFGRNGFLNIWFWALGIKDTEPNPRNDSVFRYEVLPPIIAEYLDNKQKLSGLNKEYESQLEKVTKQLEELVSLYRESADNYKSIMEDQQDQLVQLRAQLADMENLGGVESHHTDDNNDDMRQG